MKGIFFEDKYILLTWLHYLSNAPEVFLVKNCLPRLYILKINSLYNKWPYLSSPVMLESIYPLLIWLSIIMFFMTGPVLSFCYCGYFNGQEVGAKNKILQGRILIPSWRWWLGKFVQMHFSTKPALSVWYHIFNRVLFQQLSSCQSVEVICLFEFYLCGSFIRKFAWRRGIYGFFFFNRVRSYWFKHVFSLRGKKAKILNPGAVVFSCLWIQSSVLSYVIVI